ncbi:MAG: single-stranded DNA-binding protein [Treponema sp.]|nr:single-stranded DNA-binding protein [Treponema sp.]
MTDLNAVLLGGRITKDAVLEKTKEDVSMVKISMAVNRSVKKKDSEEWEDKTCFVDLAPIYGKYAESMVKYLTKGTYITVKAILDMDSWTDTEGKKHQQLKVVPENGSINPWIGYKKKNEGESAEDVKEETTITSEPSEGSIF